MEIILPAITSIITGCIAAFLTARFALNRFYAEKWWEKKSNEFLRLVDGIYKIERYLQYHNDIIEGYNPSLFHLNEDDINIMKSDFYKSTNELKKISFTASLILNNECETEIKKYFHKCEEIIELNHYGAIDSNEAIVRNYSLIIELREFILKDAKKSLKANK